MSKNLSSIYNIKDYVSNTLAPKYFNMDQVNDLNIGHLGFTTELVSNLTEDSFNTITTYINEMHPNLAILSETIYNQAALFQDSDLFATPAEMSAWMFISENFVLANMSPESSSSSNRFYIDSAMVVDVEGVQFMLDYDIAITVQNNGNENIYSVQYDTRRHNTGFTNDLSTITSGTSPYIKTKRIYYNGEYFIAMMVDMHQITRHRIDETVINNTVLNATSFTIRLDGEIAGFNVFCKLSTETQYTQLKKQMLGTPAVKDIPFCYYRLTDDDELEISFTLKDGYYKPDFGAELIIEYYTTLGTNGNFDLYTGNNIVATGTSEIYPYNNGMVVFCIPHSDSKYGDDKITVDELKNQNIENFSTVKSYTTENDLQLYFSRFKGYNNVKTHTVKRRDDIEERIFSAFTRYISVDGDIIRTNTCNLSIGSSATVINVDGVPTVTSINDAFNNFTDEIAYIHPGERFIYDGTSNNVIAPISQEEIDTESYINIGDVLSAGNYWVVLVTRRHGFTLPTDITADNSKLVLVQTDEMGLYFKLYLVTNGVRTELTLTPDVDTDYGTQVFRQLFDYANHFVFTNPYLIAMTPSPSVGYYLNTINKKYIIDYKEVNNESFDQFMCNSISIKRNAINGDDEAKKTYTFTALITPTNDYDVVTNDNLNTVTTELGSFKRDTGEIVLNEFIINADETIPAGEYYITVNDVNYVFEILTDINAGGYILINISTDRVLYVTGGTDSTADEVLLYPDGDIEDATQLTYEHGTLSKLTLQVVLDSSVYILMNIVSYDEVTNIYTMTGTMTTTDILSANNFQVTNVYSYTSISDTNFENGNIMPTAQIPMTNCPVTINARFTNYPQADVNEITYSAKTTITNVYTTRDNMTFIYPLNMVRSNLVFSKASAIEENPVLSGDISADDYNSMLDIYIDSFPVIAESIIYDSAKFEELLSYFIDQYEYIYGISKKLTNNHTIDLKFYNTYGRSKNFIMETGELIESVNVGITFKIKVEYGTNTDDLIRDIRLVIKNYIESINEAGGNAVYVSNIIQLIENQFSAVRYMKFGGIHKFEGSSTEIYPLDTQTIENVTVDLDSLSSEERRNYVPEFLNISVEDIDIVII